MLFALLPAAGHSTRMGRPKLSLPLGDRTVIEQVIATLKSAGINQILVVVGPHVPELAALATNADADALLLDTPTADMRETVEIGLKWVESHWRPSCEDAFLLVPADHPTIEPRVVCELRDAKVGQTFLSAGRQECLPHFTASIFIPTWQGKRGHPTLLGWRHVAGFRALAKDVGLNAYLRAHPEEVREVPVESESILFDMDTPADYERIRSRFAPG